MTTKQQQAKHTPFQIPTTKDFATQEACGCIHGIIGGHPRLQFCHTHKAAPELLAALKALNLECLCDPLNPCWDNRPTDKIGLHWASEIDAPLSACSSCNARAAIAKAEGR